MALLFGMIFAKFTNTAIQCSFSHGTKIYKITFRNSLIHRHSGMFLAGIQWLKTLDACLRRHDERISDGSATDGE